MLCTRKALSFLGLMVVAGWLSTAAQAQESYYAAGYEDATEAAETADAAEVVGSCDYGCGCSDYGCGNYGCGGCGCGDGGCGCGGGGCGCCDPCCRSQGLTYGAEVLWLKPHRSGGFGFEDQLRFNMLNSFIEGFGEIDGEDLFDNQIDQFALDYETSYRVWIGWQRCDGLGVRTRYWQFDHGFTSGVNRAPEQSFRVGITEGDGEDDPVDIDVVLDDEGQFAFTHQWDAWYWDLEFTDSSKIGCNWDLTLSGGFRYVDYKETAGLLDLADDQGVFSQLRFNGIGLTMAAEVRRQITCNLGIFANFRYSILMGDEDNTIFDTGDEGDETEDGSDIINALTIEHRDEVKCIYELQAGAEYIMPICCGGYYFIRGGIEMQYWDGFGVDNTPFVIDDEFADGSNFLTAPENGSVGFGGWFIAAGLQR